jgi:predicted flap endonuclease-1-like 5' DNA nuclease
MGSLFHIAEVAVLLLLAYTIGWLAGYFARRLASRGRRPAEIAGTVDAKAVIAAESAVGEPAIAPGAEAAAAPATESSVVASDPAAPEPPDGLLVGAQATPVASVPVSGLESLKSLATDMPLMPAAAPEAPAVDAAASADVARDETVPAVAQPLPEAGPEIVGPVPATVPGDGPPEIASPSASAEDTMIMPSPAAPAGGGVDAAAPSEDATVPGGVVEADEAAAPASTATPASVAGMPWSGAMHGRAPERVDIHAGPVERPSSGAPAVETETAPMSAVDGAVSPRQEPASAAMPIATFPTGGDREHEHREGEEPAGLDVGLLAAVAEELQPGPRSSEPAAVTPDPAAAEVAMPPQAEPAASATAPERSAPPESAASPPSAPEPETVVAPPPEPARRELDEDAAMRAIEGGWSRRDARALPDAPELTDVTAAVSAAQIAVEQVLARNGVTPAGGDAREQAAFGKPRGLPHARNGARDDLKQISGLGPLDESALNNLGIYHFDQVAGWDEREVLWLENHAFARGRIGREQWQAQARALAGGDAPLRARR